MRKGRGGHALLALALLLAGIPADAVGEPPSISDADRKIADEILESAGMSRGEIEASEAWDRCTEAAIDRFADQPEPAATIVEGAMATCAPERMKLMRAMGISYPEAIEKAAPPGLLARVMAVRAFRAAQKQGR
ncbi:MAG TPA: hypothetical protein VIM52_01990 [Stellaceae bacterium]